MRRRRKCRVFRPHRPPWAKRSCLISTNGCVMLWLKLFRWLGKLDFCHLSLYLGKPRRDKIFSSKRGSSRILRTTFKLGPREGSRHIRLYSSSVQILLLIWPRHHEFSKGSVRALTSDIVSWRYGRYATSLSLGSRPDPGRSRLPSSSSSWSCLCARCILASACCHAIRLSPSTGARTRAPASSTASPPPPSCWTRKRRRTRRTSTVSGTWTTPSAASWSR
mmetsp:Transcript_76829/g.207269  ORF Transcript_76829/g.207269 Transcript_76829/m.207269 type:complete len:221 (-) Transcript_76829:81-743(-)